MRSLLQGALLWMLGLVLALRLPGSVWKGLGTTPAFPWQALGPAAGAVGTLALLAPLAAWLGGPRLAHRRALALLEAPPDLLWAALLLALWPAVWGAPGLGGWLLAFLAAALPGEIRWLCQALPDESPFPEAWGAEAVKRVRKIVLLRLWGRWLAARLPLWLTATLILERILGVAGLGSDWMTRVATRDRSGLAVWILALALLWLLSRPLEREDT
jgi:F0F1-type ATP synthase assembly protein I